jgi:uncharacterized OB-fold protein
MTPGRQTVAPLPLPDRSGPAEEYGRALEQGTLIFQHCDACGSVWLPPFESCPRCLSPEPGWRIASGRGQIISWVVYHHVYHDAFRDREPYNVALVELDEGPRMITNIVGSGDRLEAGLAVSLRIDSEQGVAVARFAIAAPGPGTPGRTQTWLGSHRGSPHNRKQGEKACQ